LFGCGLRSAREALPYVEATFPRLRCIGQLDLCDERFYHTALALSLICGRRILYYPPAFTPASQRLLEAKFEHRIQIGERDALQHLVCNSIPVGDKLLMHDCTRELECQIKDWGLEIIRCDTSEFLKSGGGVRCLILALE